MSNKVFSSEVEYDEAYEKEFKAKIQEIAYYQGDRERVTIDGEWTETELKDDVYEEVNKIIDKIASKYEHRAMYDNDLLIPAYMSTHICDTYDLIEVYNRAYAKHRNDKPVKFGIHYFDELVKLEVEKTLKKNLVGGK